MEIKQRKLGRPKSDKPHSNKVLLSLTDEDYARLVKSAGKKHIPLATLAACIVIEALDKGEDYAGLP